MVILFTAYMVDRLVVVIDGAGEEGGWAARHQKCRRSQSSGSRSAGSAPRQGDGNGDGSSGTAMVAARGGTRQSWQQEGGGDGD